MFIPMWLIYVAGGLVIAHIWTLHSQRDNLRKALGQATAQLEECQQELEDIRSDDEDEPDGRMNA
jgi:hypothetical protein